MDFARAWQPKAAARWSRRDARAGESGLAPESGADARRPPMETLRHRRDFLAAAGGAKAPAAAFVLQVRERRDEGPARVGYTVSRKVGTAVERNRARRRLREIVRKAAPAAMRRGHDYVLIARRPALELGFERMIEDFEKALRRVHGRQAAPAR